VQGARTELAGLKAERAAVAAGTQEKLSDGAKATEASLNKYFKSSSDRTIAKVDRVLSQTERILKDNGTKYNFQSISSNAIANSRAGPGTLAVAHPFLGNNIYLTPAFHAASISIQAATSIHESAHLQGINAFPPLPEAYGDDIFALGAFRSRNNADNYSQFVTD
jgi:hypothetical protein